MRNSQASKNGFVRMVLSPRNGKLFVAASPDIEVRSRRHDLDGLEPAAACPNEPDDGSLRIAGAAQLGDTILRVRSRHGGEEAAGGLRIEQQRIIRMRGDRLEAANAAG